MLVQILKPNFHFEDERGYLVQLVREGYRQVNVVFSKEGSERGNHLHRRNTETFYVISGQLSLRVAQGCEKESYEFVAGDMFMISPGVLHSFSYLKDTLLVSMYSFGVELPNGGKDIYTEE